MLENKEYRSLVVIPTDKKKDLQKVSKSDIYIEDQDELRPLSSEEKLYLAVLGHNSVYSPDNMSPDLAALVNKKRLEGITVSLDYLNLLKRRLHIILLLNTNGGFNDSLNSHLNLLQHVNNQGGAASVLGGDRIVSSGAHLFMAFDPQKRYVSESSKLIFHLSNLAANPSDIYAGAKNKLKIKKARNAAREYRRQEIEEFRQKLLPVLQGQFQKKFQAHIDRIPLVPPGPDDKEDDRPFIFKGKDLVDMNLANLMNGPEQTFSELSSIPYEKAPEGIQEFIMNFDADYIRSILRS